MNLLTYASPAFVILLIGEVVLARRQGKEIGTRADSVTSISMGLGYLVITAGWKVAVFAFYVFLYELTPLRVDGWWAVVALFFLDDLAYYCFHRTHHRARVLWASHVVHHSSEHYNLSTALRQPWTPFSAALFWIPLVLLGFSPVWVVTAQAVNLLYQFWIHTTLVDRLGPLEWVLNTPSHHRAHHGSNRRYLDRNYAGILIIWDRLFGTFEPESADDPVRYGLTKNIDTHNVLRVAFHEWLAIAHDVRHASGLRTRLGHIVGPPGWAPRPAASVDGAVQAREAAAV